MSYREICRFSLSQTACYKAWRLIKQYDKDYETCSDCRLIHGLTWLIDHWRELPADHQAKVREILRALDIEELVTAHYPKRDIGFICPTTEEKVLVPCNLSSCKFHVPYTWANNCLLGYMLQQSKQSLSFEEVAFLYRMPVRNVQELFQVAIKSIQRKFLADTLDVPRYVYFPTRKLCCVCECRIDKYLARTGQLVLPGNLVDEELGLVYCSPDCQRAKPRRLIELEMEFETHITHILTGAFRTYKNDTSWLLISSMYPSRF